MNGGISFVQQPSVITVLLIGGMALLICGTATNDRSIGSMGLICLIAVPATHIVHGIGSELGMVLLLAGTGLLFAEARLFPGHGICAAGGLCCIFIGLQQTVGVLEGGGIRGLLVSSTVTGLSFVELLVSIPGNKKWSDLNKRLRTSTGSLVSNRILENSHAETSSEGTAKIERIAPQWYGASLELDDLQADLKAIKESSLPILAREGKAQRELLSLRDEETRIYAEAMSAASQGRDDLALQILQSRESLLDRIRGVEHGVASAREEARAIRRDIEFFRNRLRMAESRSSEREKIREMIAETGLLSARDLHSRQQIDKMAEGICTDDLTQTRRIDVSASDEHKKRAASALAALKDELRRRELPSDDAQQNIQLDR